MYLSKVGLMLLYIILRKMLFITGLMQDVENANFTSWFLAVPGLCLENALVLMGVISHNIIDCTFAAVNRSKS